MQVDQSEVFRPIPGYEGRYEASSLGRIKSVLRNIILRPVINPVSEYHTVNIRRDDESIRCPKGVHVLVASTFLGPCLEGQEVRHFPKRDRSNNKPNNLCYGTRSENLKDREVHGTMLRGEKVWNSKLTEQDVREIKYKLASGGYGINSKLGREYGVAHQTIYDIKKNRKWAWLV